MPTCLSFDVEEYFHIEAAHGHIDRANWDTLESRVEASVNWLLEQLEHHQRPATFFVLGDVAKRCPAIAPRIAQAGHEIASHGHGHARLHRLDPDSFRQDLSDSKKRLEDQTGSQVIGYRAPTFSIVPQTAWAIDVLAELGFQYDASVFPVSHPAYGVPDAPVSPFWITGESSTVRMLEVPPLVWQLPAGKNMPVAGGGYFRLFPLSLMKQGLKQAAAKQRPSILYFHPWEFDPDIPRLPLGRLGTFRTYVGLKSSGRKLQKLLSLPRNWTTMVQSLACFKQLADQVETYALKK